ncbi:MAG: RNA polymerase-binding protein RbpA [Microbacteriaceae bacterium]|nr:RNA polymerase-binding protein RbpA [Microbacteriaceae bacterium]
MADRSLRGMRLGSQSLQSEDGVEFAERITATYRIPGGEDFEITLSADAEIPETWESPLTAEIGILLSPDGTPVMEIEDEDKVVRTHWDMLLERRSEEELEELLQDRLHKLRVARGKIVDDGNNS